MKRSTAISWLAVLFMFALAVSIGIANGFKKETGLLTVSFLDVGQGDAIFITSPTGVQVLIDAGKGREVLRKLPSVLPWYDRSIDVLIATHPDADHIGGMPDILKRYKVTSIIESSVDDENGVDAKAFAAAASAERAQRSVALRGQTIDIGGAHIEILFPDRDVSGVETNTGSIIAKVVYGKTSFMLTGDAPDEIENYLVRINSKSLDADVLKAGHHGSRTSSSEDFIRAVSPAYAIFSRGCDNSYGHPHKEVVERFAQLDIQTLDTCEEGTIQFTSDGNQISLN